ncbi:hypothetical protein JCM24511_06702 [Saitozyma sp. JCM 24511]|nr:hypothetical protein JCM24511_06702 [Saitozyma sp. JCM 24511]
MGSTSVSFSSSETPGKAETGKSRPTLRILTDLGPIPTVPTVPTTHQQPIPRYHRAIKTAPLLAGFSVVHLGELREDNSAAPSLLARRKRREVAVFEFDPSLGGDENAARRGVSRLLQKPGWSEGTGEIEAEGVHLSGEEEAGTVREVEMVEEKGMKGEAGMVGELPSGRKRVKRHRRTISDKVKSLLVFHRESRTGTIPPSHDGQVEHADKPAHLDASADLEVILPARPYRSPGTASFMVARSGPDHPLSSRNEHHSLAVDVDPEVSVSDGSCSPGASTPSGTVTSTP